MYNVRALERKRNPLPLILKTHTQTHTCHAREREDCMPHYFFKLFKRKQRNDVWGE